MDQIGDVDLRVGMFNLLRQCLKHFTVPSFNGNLTVGTQATSDGPTFGRLFSERSPDWNTASVRIGQYLSDRAVSRRILEAGTWRV